MTWPAGFEWFEIKPFLVFYQNDVYLVRRQPFEDTSPTTLGHKIFWVTLQKARRKRLFSVPITECSPTRHTLNAFEALKNKPPYSQLVKKCGKLTEVIETALRILGDSLTQKQIENYSKNSSEQSEMEAVSKAIEILKSYRSV